MENHMGEEIKLRKIIKKYSSQFPGVEIGIVSEEEIAELKKKISKKKKSKQLRFNLK